MMLKATDFQIRKRNGSGLLEASGFEFYEAIPIGISKGCLALFFYLAAILLGIVVFANFMTGSVPQITIILAVAMVGLGWIGWVMSHPKESSYRAKRAIVFFADDRIVVSNKKSAVPEFLVSPVKVSDVETIHWRASPAIDGSGQGTISHGLTAWFAWQVDFHLRDGQTVCMAFPITSEEDARFISTQLNEAFQSLVTDMERSRP